MKTFLGIDPGRTGGFAMIHSGGLTLWEMPPESQRGVSLLTLERLIICEAQALSDMELPIVGLEWNVAHPDNVPDHAFRFGLQTGQIHAMFFAHKFQLELISPQLWMAKLGLPGKQFDPECRQRLELLRKHYPHALVIGPRGGVLDGLVEAALIAIYLRIVHATPISKKSGPRPPKFRGIIDDEQM